EAALYGTTLGEPIADDDAWGEKLALLRDERVPVASFTFGCPAKATISTLKRYVSDVVVTVTSAAEARHAEAAGADALCVQAPEAQGGADRSRVPPHRDHQGVHRPPRPWPGEPLHPGPLRRRPGRLPAAAPPHQEPPRRGRLGRRPGGHEHVGRPGPPVRAG